MCYICAIKEMTTTAVFLPKKSHGQGSLASYGTWNTT